MLWRLYLYETLLEGLAQDLEDMTAALGPFIENEHAVVGQRHLARHGHVAAADPPGVGNRVMGRAARAGRHQGRAVARQAGDAGDARGLDGLGQGPRRQEGGEAAGEHRLAGPRGPEEHTL
jgi:hypothetical protein